MDISYFGNAHPRVMAAASRAAARGAMLVVVEYLYVTGTGTARLLKWLAYVLVQL